MRRGSYKVRFSKGYGRGKSQGRGRGSSEEAVEQKEEEVESKDHPTSLAAPEPEEELSNKEREERIHDPDYIKESLKGYFLVPEEYWDQISAGDSVRYIDRDGGLRLGGFIWFSKELKGKKYWCIGKKRTPDFSGRSFFYKVGRDRIQKLFKKLPPEAALLWRSLDRKQEYIETLVGFLRRKFGRELDEFLISQEIQKGRNPRLNPLIQTP